MTWKGIEESGQEVARLTDEAVAGLKSLGKNDKFLEELLRWLVYREK